MSSRNDTGSGASSYGLAYRHKADPRAEMERFDRLPKALRDVLNEAPVSPAIKPVLDLIEQGAPMEYVLEVIRRNLAKIPLSFVKEE